MRGAQPAYGLWVFVLSGGLTLAGSALLVWARRALRSARQRGVLAVRGPYSFVRHPQYLAFAVIMLGLLLHWPTPAGLLVFATLSWGCVRLARKEERRMDQEFGTAWGCYAYGRPAFLPRLSRERAALPGFVEKDRGWNGTVRANGSRTPATQGRARS